MQNTPTTELCTHSLTSMHYRDKDLVNDLIGQCSFTEVMYLQIMGRKPRPVDLRIIDAVLITLMEHGLTPSAIAARMVYTSAPESLQGAISAGLLAVGSQFVGTMENCAQLLQQIRASSQPEDTARALALQYKNTHQPIPGFGHHLHKPDDPRSLRLIQLAQAEEDLQKQHLEALLMLSRIIDEVYGKHITINATGAVAALLGEIDIPIRLMRGFAVISRAAGLVAHIAEEQRMPAGRFIWDTVDRAIPYVRRNTDDDPA